MKDAIRVACRRCGADVWEYHGPLWAKVLPPIAYDLNGEPHRCVPVRSAERAAKKSRHEERRRIRRRSRA